MPSTKEMYKPILDEMETFGAGIFYSYGYFS